MEQMEYQNEYWKILVKTNNVCGMMSALKVYVETNNINLDITPLQNCMEDLNILCNNQNNKQSDFKSLYNEAIILLNRSVSKMDMLRFYYKFDCYIVTLLSNIVESLNIIANLNYKACTLKVNPNTLEEEKRGYTEEEEKNIKPQIIKVKLNYDEEKENKRNNKKVNKTSFDFVDDTTNFDEYIKNSDKEYVFKNAQNLLKMTYNKAGMETMTFKKSNKTYTYKNIDMDFVNKLIEADRQNNHPTTLFLSEIVAYKEKYPYALIK